MDIEIKPMDYKRDISSIVILEKELFDDPFLRGQLYFYHQKYDTFASYVAIIDNSIVGYVFTILEEENLHIYTIGVKREFQRLGIARDLLRKVKEIAIARILPIVLEVSMKNLTALELYTSEGFVRLGSEEMYYPDGSTAHFMKWTPHHTDIID